MSGTFTVLRESRQSRQEQASLNTISTPISCRSLFTVLLTLYSNTPIAILHRRAACEKGGGGGGGKIAEIAERAAFGRLRGRGAVERGRENRLARATKSGFAHAVVPRSTRDRGVAALA